MNLPLARFLPPIPVEMVSTWLAENVPAGSWVLDPLGASPALVLEAARAGYRVLVASNNPINSFLLETLAGAPEHGAIQSALAELAMAKRGDERLEKHLQNLYLTECESCGEWVQADAFLWRKGEETPFARLYRCPKCGEAPAGERPVTKADLERLESMGGDRLQRSRALQRVILNDEEHRADVEAALECYKPRALYVIFTLINKIEGLPLPPDRLRLLHALLLHVLDEGNTLWTWPAARARPRQLTVPPQYRENNLWTALEESAGLWGALLQAPRRPVPTTRWPEVHKSGASGSICLFRGRIKALVPLPPEIQPAALITAFPRPNQAYWTLSALWSGWLWGAEAALPLRNALDRRRYDWHWHASAVHNALNALAGALPSQPPFLGLLPEVNSGFLSAVLVAAQAAGMEMQDVAMRSSEELAQVLWKPSPNLVERRSEEQEEMGPSAGGQALEAAARAAIQADLQQRNEPAPYLIEYAAGLVGMVRAGAVARSPNNLPGETLTGAQAVLARTFADRSLLQRYGGRTDSGAGADEERGWWWLARPPQTGSGPEDATGLPLADRVEMEAVRFMQRRNAFSLGALDSALCGLFPGLSTPDLELVRACLESYGEAIPHQPGSYRMRESEMAAARRTDLQEMRALIEQAGQVLGYQTIDRDGVLAWETSIGKPAWWFLRMASSIISRYVLSPSPGPANRTLLVIPGGRARLLRLKLRRDPRLAEAAQSWQFLKFRHLRNLASRPDLTPVLWEAGLAEDPLTEEATQMSLFAP